MGSFLFSVTRRESARSSKLGRIWEYALWHKTSIQLLKNSKVWEQVVGKITELGHEDYSSAVSVSADGMRIAIGSGESGAY
jgi:hypothetical protein